MFPSPLGPIPKFAAIQWNFAIRSNPKVEGRIMLDASYQKISRYLAENPVETPALVVDLAGVRQKYRELHEAFPRAHCHYAVKSNPAMPILKLLVQEGSFFDIASPQELHMALEAGATPEQILYSNTIKKPSEIKTAYEAGVRLFGFDSVMELEKLAQHAPGAKVLCRVKTSGYGAQWPLSRKFGCDAEDAIELLAKAPELGLVPHATAFHVGSQMMVLESWDLAIKQAAYIAQTLKDDYGIALPVINMGGGFPARYREPIPSIGEQARFIHASLLRHFPEGVPQVIIEPGRYMAAEAGLIESEVILISQNHKDDPRRWVYLDVGKFTGLTEAEAIEYPIVTARDHDAKGPVVIAGNTCDSIDIIYEEAHYELPMTLQAGDRVRLLSTGSYTTTYSSVAFNGFPPLREYYIP